MRQLKKAWVRLENWFYGESSIIEYLIFFIICMGATLWMLNQPPYHLGWLVWN